MRSGPARLTLPNVGPPGPADASCTQNAPSVLLSPWLFLLRGCPSLLPLPCWLLDVTQMSSPREALPGQPSLAQPPSFCHPAGFVCVCVFLIA